MIYTAQLQAIHIALSMMPHYYLVEGVSDKDVVIFF